MSEKHEIIHGILQDALSSLGDSLRPLLTKLHGEGAELVDLRISVVNSYSLQSSEGCIIGFEASMEAKTGFVKIAASRRF